MKICGSTGAWLLGKPPVSFLLALIAASSELVKVRVLHVRPLVSSHQHAQVRGGEVEVTEAPGAQRRVLECFYFVSSELLAQSFGVPKPSTNGVKRPSHD